MESQPLTVETVANLFREAQRLAREWSLNHLSYCATGTKSEFFDTFFTETDRMMKVVGPFGMWRMKIFHHESQHRYTGVTPYMDATLTIDREQRTITVTIPMDGWQETFTLSRKDRPVKRQGLSPFGAFASSQLSLSG